MENKNENGDTAIIGALLLRRFDILKTLIEDGNAKFDSIEDRKVGCSSILDFAFVNFEEKTPDCDRKCIAEMTQYLIDNGADVRQRNFCFKLTPLHSAASKGFLEALKVISNN